MKCNENVMIIGTKVILVPYEAKHVPKYHEWMKDPELQELTASEPLTLDEEYDMQKSWRNDEDKCTFLVLSKDMYTQSSDEIAALVGDTNLFLSEGSEGRKIAEAEIMIAEKNCRGQHFGWDAMLLMLQYGIDELNIDEFIVKIGEQNVKSLKMFRKMKFCESSRSNVFKEITLNREVSKEWLEWLKSQLEFHIEPYNKFS